jgi:2',3'-cyclic-nucleotide 2'-phosphodiesterase/3'-nucleotidase/5'-nucleotidase
MKLHPLFLTAATLGLPAVTLAQGLPALDLDLVPLGTYESGLFDESAAEIVAHDPNSQRLFIVNAFANSIDVVSIADPSNPTLVSTVDMSPYGGGLTSIDVGRGKVAGLGGVAYQPVVAVAVKADPETDPGMAVFLDTDGNFLSSVQVGYLPDMITFTPSGNYVLTANEGQPSDDYTIDPVGSISVIDVSGLITGIQQSDVRDAGFEAFNGGVPGVRVFGPGATLAQDMEPEYIAVSKNSRRAYVACQENNALAIVDIQNATVIDIKPLGTKDHSLAGNELDPSNQDGGINIQSWPVKGFYMPDTIKSFRTPSGDFLITANEGDSRDYGGYSEEERIKDLLLDPVAFPDAAFLQANENLGRLKTTTANGDTDGDGDYDELYSYGARSFSIWDLDGNLVFDSGAQFEQLIAQYEPAEFNSTNDENGSFDDRSDDKGPEPEGVEIGRLYGRRVAFVGFERHSAIVAYDCTIPSAPAFIGYFSNRDFTGDAAAGTAGDLGPEGMLFIPQGQSPTGTPLLVVGNEVSGTTTVWEIQKL